MFPEKPQKNEQNSSPEAEKINSFEELYAFLRSKKEIHGSWKSYSPDTLIKTIERVRHGHLPLDFITRTMNIRDTVERLLSNDKVYLKYTKGSKAKKK